MLRLLERPLAFAMRQPEIGRRKVIKLKLVARSEIKLKALEADLVSHGATDVEVLFTIF